MFAKEYIHLKGFPRTQGDIISCILHFEMSAQNYCAFVWGRLLSPKFKVSPMQPPMASIAEVTISPWPPRKHSRIPHIFHPWNLVEVGITAASESIKPSLSDCVETLGSVNEEKEEGGKARGGGGGGKQEN
jgi:hypothetical protein